METKKTGKLFSFCCAAPLILKNKSKKEKEGVNFIFHSFILIQKINFCITLKSYNKIKIF